MKWIPKGPLYILFDAHDKILNKLSGKYNFHSLHNNIPSYQNKIPIYCNADDVPESGRNLPMQMNNCNFFTYESMSHFLATSSKVTL